MSINNSIKSLFNGDLFKQQYTINEQDIAALKAYNSEIERGITPTTAYYKTLQNASDAAVNIARSAGDTTVNLEEIPKVSNAGKMALQAIITAGNAFLMLGISLVIGLVIKGIDYLIHSAEHCKERVDSLMSSYKSALDTANSNAKTVENLAGRYEELSKGVNGLGETYGLTAAEASEYHDICNQIADMFPSLVRGYTDEGNAILSLKDNIDQLRDAYKATQQEAYNLLVTGGKDSAGNDIIKNWKNLQETGFWAKLFDMGSSDVDGYISKKEAIDQLKAISEMSAETYRNIVVTFSYGTNDDYMALSEIEKAIGCGSYVNKALGISYTSTDEEFEAAKIRAKALAQTYQVEIDSALNNVQALANAYLMTNEDYALLDEPSKNAASVIINSINERIANGFDNEIDVSAYVVDIVSMIKDNHDIQDALVGLFDLDITDMPISEAQNLIDVYIKSIAKKLGEDELELKARLGFESTDDIVRELQDSIQRLSSGDPLSEQDLAEYTKDFTQSQAKLWLETTRDAENAAWAKQIYENRLAEIEKSRLNWSGLTEDQSKSIDEFQSKVNTLSSTLSSLQSGTTDSTALTDLFQEFPELCDQTDNLEEAIQNLITTLLNKLYSSLGTNIPPALKESLQSLADEAINTASGIKSVSASISDLNTVYDLMQSLQEEISGGGISSATLRSIIDQYPLLEDAVNAYCAGLLTETELYGKLSQQYDHDLEAFQTASRAKIYVNELFYDQCLNSNSGLVNELAEAYQLDFRNFKTVEAAKLAGEKKLLGNMAGLWSKYYNIVLDKDGLYRVQGTAFSETYDAQNSSEYIELEKKTQEIQKFLDQLNKAFQLDTVAVMNFTPGSLSQKSSSSISSGAEEYSEELNWVEKLITRASTALDKLKDKISNTYISWSLRNHSLALAMDKTRQSILTQQQAYETYMRKAASVGLSQEYVDKIQNGSLEIETITDETLSEKIRQYETWYDKAAACSDAIEELKTRLAELAKQKFDNINAYFTSLMETTEKSIAQLKTQESNTFKTIDVSVYRSQYAETQTLISYNTQRTRQLEEALDSAVNSGYIESGSEAWRDMYNEILEVRNATEEYRNELNELAQKEYDALLKPFETILDRLDQRKSVIETMIERLELQGHTASRGLYERQLRDGEARLQSLADQAAQLRQNMQDAMAKGLETGSDQWLEMQAAIDENISSTMELENSILQLKNTIRELDWEKFDRLQSSLSHVTDESDFLMELLDQDDLYDEDGRLNQEGNAILGLHARNYFAQLEQAGQYQAELNKITEELASDPYNTTLEQRKYDLADAYRAATKAAYEEYHAITELGQKGYQSQIDAIQELIDARKKQLDMDKSLYEHQKNIADKTRNIADIQKQLSALAGDESEENKAKIQKLQVDLEEAQKDLEETTYDKWYSDQSDMLDKLAEEYEALISEQSQEEQAIFQEMISSANANAQSIQNTITAVAQRWGYRPSTDINSAWTPGTDGVTDIRGNVSDQIYRLYELNEILYQVSAALGDLGVTDYGLETTISDSTTAKSFINRLYQGLLGRQPDEAGMNFWLERLTGGATVQDILEGFLQSPEYLAMNKSVSDTILDFYEGLLGRTAETAGYQYWMAQYRDGMSLSEIGTHGFLDSREFLSDKMWLSLADNSSFLALENLLPSLNTVRSHTSNTAGSSAPSFGDININIPIEHVSDYNDFVTQLQKDGKFERMVQDMTIGQVMGRGSLSKNSYRF